jgi:hypothetical protein
VGLQFCDGGAEHGDGCLDGDVVSAREGDDVGGFPALRAQQSCQSVGDELAGAAGQLLLAALGVQHDDVERVGRGRRRLVLGSAQNIFVRRVVRGIIGCARRRRGRSASHVVLIFFSYWTCRGSMGAVESTTAAQSVARITTSAPLTVGRGEHIYLNIYMYICLSSNAGCLTSPTQPTSTHWQRRVC